MEGKEHYNDDEEQNSKSNKDENEDADNFGLPEIEDESDKGEDLGDPFSDTWQEEKEEEIYSNPDDYPVSESTESTYDYTDDPDESDTTQETYKSSYYEEEYGRKKSPVIWIVLGIVMLVAIIIGIFWWMNRTPEEPPVVTPVIERPVERQPEPVVQKEPEPTPEPVKQAGVFEINQPTGRYHVIVASSIDKDLVLDYGNRLAKKGMTCNVLAPRGNRKFHRLSVADYASLNDAAIKSEQLKSEFGDEVWVIRY